ILPVVFFVIFLLLYLVFSSAAKAAVRIFPTLYGLAGLHRPVWNRRGDRRREGFAHCGPRALRSRVSGAPSTLALVRRGMQAIGYINSSMNTRDTSAGIRES